MATCYLLIGKKVFSSVSVVDKWDAFLSLFLPILNRHAPVTKMTIRNPTAPPVSEATKELMTRRRKALKDKGRRSIIYRELNRFVRAAIRKDTRNNIQSRINEQGPASVWRNIRSVIQSKKGGQRVVPDTSVDDLNRYFVGVGPKVASEVTEQGPAPVLNCRLPRVGACGFTLSPVTLTMLQQTLTSMSSTAASGSDGICIRVVKVAFPLSVVCYSTLLTLVSPGQRYRFLGSTHSCIQSSKLVIRPMHRILGRYQLYQS